MAYWDRIAKLDCPVSWAQMTWKNSHPHRICAGGFQNALVLFYEHEDSWELWSLSAASVAEKMWTLLLFYAIVFAENAYIWAETPAATTWTSTDKLYSYFDANQKIRCGDDICFENSTTRFTYLLWLKLYIYLYTYM